jgi:hypothetical protein
MVLEKLHHHFYMSYMENAKHFQDQLNYLLIVKQILCDARFYKTKNKKSIRPNYYVVIQDLLVETFLFV